MASMAQVHSLHIPGNCYRSRIRPVSHIASLHLPNQPFKSDPNIMFSSLKSKAFKPSLLTEFPPMLISGGGSRSGVVRSIGGGDGLGLVAAFVSGWSSRVAADPQFLFKVLMEEVVGVSSAVIGDMASRPNFGLNELDFVFSTLVVGSIVNFTLMYLLAPTISSTTGLPFIFANCPTSHMFETGPFTLVNRLGTLVYKGTLFAAVGLFAGLVGTALSNGLIKMRKKMDPNFEAPNKPPPMFLNAITWAIHMGVSSNLRYQTLNGIEFLLAKSVSPVIFKTFVVALRMVNNVLGGMTFVMLARVTGSQASTSTSSAASEKNVKTA